VISYSSTFSPILFAMYLPFTVLKPFNFRRSTSTSLFVAISPTVYGIEIFQACSNILYRHRVLQ